MTGNRPARNRPAVLLVALVALGATACRQDMHDAPRIDPFEASDFFADGMSARPLPAGTVPRGHLNEDPHRYEGKDASGTLVDDLPAEMPLDSALLARGQSRYEIFCTPCHDKTGSGRGMIVRRGFQQPESYHTDRLRAMPIGYFFDVMTNGFGQMSSYARQVPVADRWAIAAYIRALQLSQNAPVDSLPAPQVAALHDALSGPHGATGHGATGHGDTEHSDGGHGDGHGFADEHHGDADHEDPYDGRSDAPEPGYGQALPIEPPTAGGDHES